MLTLKISDLEEIRDLLTLLRVHLRSAVDCAVPIRERRHISPDFVAELKHNLKMDRRYLRKCERWLESIDANIGRMERAALRKPLPPRPHPSHRRPPVRGMPRNIPLS